MSNTRAGSALTLSARHGTAGAYTMIAGPGIISGFTGLDMNPEPQQYAVSGGGFSGSRNSGTVVLPGSFTIGETEDTLAIFLGRNGARIDYQVQWDTGITDSFQACTTVSRTFNERGDRVFNITFTVDGNPTRT